MTKSDDTAALTISFEALGQTFADHVVVFAAWGGSDPAAPSLVLAPSVLETLSSDVIARIHATAGIEKFKAGRGKAMVLTAASGSIARLIVMGLGPHTAEALPAGATKEPIKSIVDLGGCVFAALKGAKSVSIVADASTPFTEADIADLTLGLRLRAYNFDRYKTKIKDRSADEAEDTKDNGKDKEPVAIAVLCVAPDAVRKAAKARDGIAQGVILARDLVNEPPNILYPASFAKRAEALEKLGIEVEVLTEKEMKRLGMGALLGVGQGSERESFVVVMRWNGAKKKDAQPVAFIGKGVTFDTGGISIKPAGGMEDMKGDMAGAACVVGLMHALASRKAKVNAIGAIGLVENMPGPNAQRPGDIVTSMSGQTIEIINTDAEGRLVLADVLWHIQTTYRPQFMVDLATLTGAILVALGQEHAGLFTNNDELGSRLSAAGIATGETVWRMPLGKVYDKMIDSKFADMKNTGGRHGGSITAAQFLQRFVGETPWAHLDVAGTAMGSPSSDTNTGWASGWGVRLLDRLVADHYEG